MAKKRNFFGPKELKETKYKKKITCQFCKKEFLGDEYYQNRQACEYCLIRVRRKKIELRTLSQSMNKWVKIEREKKKSENLKERKQRVLDKEQRFLDMLSELERED